MQLKVPKTCLLMNLQIPRTKDSKDFLSHCKLVEGDFFKSIPLGGDGYIIKNVILNWDDDSAAKILENCLQAMEKTKATNATTTMMTANASRMINKTRIILSY